jgi:glycosyltransferase involved in cell wall biosynthesis
MFGWEFPPHQAGGLATATVGLVKGLLRVGVDVTLVVPFPVEDSPIPGLRLVGAEATSDRLVVHRVPSLLSPYAGAERYQEVFARARTAPGGPRAVYGKTLFAEVDRFADVASEIAAREPHDVIDTHDWMTFEAGVRARARSGRPLVSHIHAIELDRTGVDGNPVIAERERQGLAQADRVVSNSHRLARLCIDRYGLDSAKVDVVHWGIDEEAIPAAGPTRRSPFTGRPIVLFLGRVTAQKGPDLFLEMAVRVARFVPAARFVVAGGGDLLAPLIERAAALGIAERVHFTGGLHGAEVAGAFSLADVCVMPSRSEPFGLVALESLLHGVPCVVPRDAGVSETLSHVFKVRTTDLEEMTEKVVAMLKHRALRRELADRGREEVRSPRFTLDEPARLTRAVYGRAMAGSA